MSVLVIRKHSRFAVCRKARIRTGGGDTLDALLVELSLDGCRIGNCDASRFSEGEIATVELAGSEPFSGEVRWLGERAVGLRLTRAFHTFELDSLVVACRSGAGDGSVALRA